MSAYRDRGKTTAKRNSGRKPTLAERKREISYNEKDFSKNHRIAEAEVTDIVGPKLHKYNIRGKATTAKPLMIAETNDSITTIRP
jgi:hypothetical protein